MKLTTTKIIVLVVTLVLTGVAGWMFNEHRTYQEAVVVSEHISEVRKLSDYDPAVKGTVNDTNVYIFDSGQPGGTFLMFGGTHPEEPACNLSAQLFTENLKVTQGRVIVIDRINRSASTNTRLGEAYPRFFHVETPWGVKRWRFGDRCANPLDSWPDPEVYVHYPSGQILANVDI